MNTRILVLKFYIMDKIQKSITQTKRLAVNLNYSYHSFR